MKNIVVSHDFWMRLTQYLTRNKINCPIAIAKSSLRPQSWQNSGGKILILLVWMEWNNFAVCLNNNIFKLEMVKTLIFSARPDSWFIFPARPGP